MEDGTATERSRLLPGPSVEYGLIGTDQSTQNIQNVNYYTDHAKTEPQNLSLKGSLYFPGMASREHNVANAHGRTCRWFLRTEEYLNWEAGESLIPKHRGCCGLLPPLARIPLERWQNRLLWIKGEAGAGKSTLMKMAVEHAKSSYKDALILPHFFNARGTALERSTEGMYRTLIYWLLEKLPQKLVAKLGFQSVYARQHKWEVAELIRLLRKAMGAIPNCSILVYIDALDECNQKEVGAMLKVFQGLVEAAGNSGQKVRVCFASRPYPHHTFKHAVYLDLSEHEEHRDDIAEYVKDFLNDGIAESIRESIHNKAAGVFMWVVLVVDMLNEKYDAGCVGELEMLVESIPSGLYELYSHILERHPGDEDAMLECFRCLLFGKYLVLPAQLWWTVQLGLRREDENIQRDYKALDKEGMMRYILHICKGLVRFHNTSYGADEAEFIHESVREFILSKDGVVLRLYGSHSRDALEAESYQRLRNSYFNEFNARRPQLLEAVKTEGPNNITDRVLVRMGWKQRKVEPRRQLPVALLAAVEMVRYAELAQQFGVDQTDFLRILLDQARPSLFITPFPVGKRQPVLGSLEGLLIAAHCPTLIHHMERKLAQNIVVSHQPLGLVDEGSEWSPVLVALIGNRGPAAIPTAIPALLGVYLVSEPRHPQLQRILQRLAAHKHYRISFTWKWPRFGALLDLADWAPLLATFFLIVLAPPHTLEPYLDSLQQLADRFFDDPGSNSAFSYTLEVFVQKQLNSAAIDVMRRDTMRWLQMESDEEIDDEERLVRQRIATLLKACQL